MMPFPLRNVDGLFREYYHLEIRSDTCLPRGFTAMVITATVTRTLVHEETFARSYQIHASQTSSSEQA